MRPILAILVVLLGCFYCVPNLHGAVKYRVVTTSRDDKGKSTSLIMEVLLDGDRGRFDFIESRGGGFKTGAYLITHDGGKSVAYVKDDKANCTIWDSQEFFGSFGRLADRYSWLVKFSVPYSKVEKVLEEKGPELLGYPTNHIRLVTTYTVHATVLWKKLRISETFIDNLWVTSDLEKQAICNQFIEAMTQTGIDKLDQLVSDFYSKIPGTILKQETAVYRRKGAEGSESVVDEVVEVTSVDELDSSEIPEDTFDIPKCTTVASKEMERLIKKEVKRYYK